MSVVENGHAPSSLVWLPLWFILCLGVHYRADVSLLTPHTYIRHTCAYWLNQSVLLEPLLLFLLLLCARNARMPELSVCIVHEMPE